MGGDQFLDHQRYPRRLFPDNILRLFIEFGFLLRVGGFQRLAQRVIHLRVAVKRGIKQRRRPVLRGEQRRQRPVGFTRGGGPAGIEHPYPALFLPFTFHFRRPLTSVHRRHLRLNPHLRQLLLGELQYFLRGAVIM